MKKRNLILGVLLVSVLFLTGCDYKIKIEEVDEEKGNSIENTNDSTGVYKEYKVGDKIVLDDYTSWMVIEDSDSSSDYVKLLSITGYNYSPNEVGVSENGKRPVFTIKCNESECPSMDILQKGVTYDNGLKSYVDNLKNYIPVNLKNVDGYDIRLITLDEILKIDNNWEYKSDSDSYTYIGKSFNPFLEGLVTMTSTKCTTGKCTNFYVSSYNSTNNEYIIEHWLSGFPNINPVINVYKSEL